MRSMRLLLFLSCCLLTGHHASAQKDAGDDWYDGRSTWKPMGVLGVALVGVTGGGLIGFATSRPESRNVVYDPSKNGPEVPQP